jgi:acyl-CoA thioesterase-1
MLRIILFVFATLTTCAAYAAPVIVVFGDSLSAGYGLPQGTGWVTLLQQHLQQEKLDYKVVNASISGETTLGGKSRITQTLSQYHPAIVIVELGANDGLRGAPIEMMRANLTAIIEACRKHGTRVVLIGMQLPPNYGIDYPRKFQKAFAAVAQTERIAFTPFLLAGFAADPSEFQADGLHPIAAVQARMLDNVWIALAPLLRRTSVE